LRHQPRRKQHIVVPRGQPTELTARIWKFGVSRGFKSLADEFVELMWDVERNKQPADVVFLDIPYA